jgi:hypothetical protein
MRAIRETGILGATDEVILCEITGVWSARDTNVSAIG